MGFFVFLGAVVMVVLVATGEYIFGRIVLPEMGLESPGWWIWFWGDFFLILFCSPFYFVKGALS